MLEDKERTKELLEELKLEERVKDLDKILVVESKKASIQGLQSYLAKANNHLTIEFAENNKEAVEKLEKTLYQGVILRDGDDRLNIKADALAQKYQIPSIFLKWCDCGMGNCISIYDDYQHLKEDFKSFRIEKWKDLEKIWETIFDQFYKTKEYMEKKNV